jgi:hypothetical protein
MESSTRAIEVGICKFPVTMPIPRISNKNADINVLVIDPKVDAHSTTRRTWRV